MFRLLPMSRNTNYLILNLAAPHTCTHGRMAKRSFVGGLKARHIYIYIWVWVKTGLPGLTRENEQNGLLRRSTYPGLGI